MNNRDLICNDEKRRHRVRDVEQFNGLDYLEVSDDQLLISVYFLDHPPGWLQKENFRIEGGARIRDIKVVELMRHCHDDPKRDDCLTIRVNKFGDFSTYTLRLVEAKDGRPTDEQLWGFDPFYSQLQFSFKANCASDLDCKQQSDCPPETSVDPDINYLAKDYSGFRRLILDRLALVMPDWQERHAADLGITLVEVLAYVGDYLSYFQDAVATEAYLDTARLRVSVRRHARLVDYAIHEGCNARAWVTVKTSQDVELSLSDFYFITGYRGSWFDKGGIVSPEELQSIQPRAYEVFEPVRAGKINLHEAHNEIRFYAWGDNQCCLLKGATSATLRDEWQQSNKDEEDHKRKGEETSKYKSLPNQSAYYDRLQSGESSDYSYNLDKKEEGRETRLRNLKAGDVLVFEEVKGPETGSSYDADPAHRHAVRLTKVSFSVDALYDVPVVEIEWAEADALPFPLCISSIGPAPGCALVDEVSVARGNCLLVDHGSTIKEELDPVPEAATVIVCEGEGRPSDITPVAGRFRPKLKAAPITFSQPLAAGVSASSALMQNPREALPQVGLALAPSGKNSAFVSSWYARRDLLRSERDDRDFVVEIDDDGRGHIRFGDGEMGAMPDAGERLIAAYRVGNGTAGNVGAEAIKHIVFRASIESGVTLEPRNPLPALGGVEPEPLREVKLFAPQAFRKEMARAVVADDYARLAERHPAVQRARATLLWNGSWHEVLVAIDPKGSAEADQALLREIEGYLYRYRRIGHDLAVARARYVPLEIALTVCVLPSSLRGHVKAAMLEAFSNRLLGGGKSGYFHPDNLTFKEGIALSKLVALAQAIEGVETVRVDRLERLFEGPNREIENGLLPLGPMEIARLDNDPNFPENGRLRLEMRGGR